MFNFTIEAMDLNREAVLSFNNVDLYFIRETCVRFVKNVKNGIGENNSRFIYFVKDLFSKNRNYFSCCEIR